MEKLVIDSTALIELPELPKGELYAPPRIFEEARSVGPQVRSRDVQLRQPTAESLRKVDAMAAKTGDTVSPADKDALALAMDMDVPLVTDDYASQNVASFLGMKFIPLSKPGITKRRVWKLKCPNCGNWLTGSVCPVCGVPGRRAVYKAEPLP